MDEIRQELTETMRKQYPKKLLSNENLNEFFIQRVKKHMHIVLCFSPSSAKFRSQMFKFPGLMSNSTIIWFQKWPIDALSEVSAHFITKLEINGNDEDKSQLIKAMGFYHDTVRLTCAEYNKKC